MKTIYLNGKFYRKSFGCETGRALADRIASTFANLGQFPVVSVREAKKERAFRR